MRYDDEYDYEDDEELTSKLRQEKIMFIVVCGFAVLAVAYFLISNLVSSVSNTEYDIWSFPLFSGFQDDYEMASNIVENVGNNNMNEWDFPHIEASGTFVKCDKNTIIINVDNTNKELLLMGVDIPQSISLAELLDSRLDEGDTLLIDYEDDSAYVYFENGTMVQNWLLVSGYAEVGKGDFSKKDDFLKSESVAKKNKVGIWKE